MSNLKQLDIIKKLKKIKPIYEKEGLMIIGLFGSYANGTEHKNSDIDILYDIKADTFCAKYPGFSSFARIEDIKQELKKIFHTKVDLATIDNDSDVFKKYALKDIVYV